MRGIIGKKLGMTQVFREDGSCVAVTVVEAGPCRVTQVRTPEKDGYTAVQLGFGKRRPRVVSRGERGHFERTGAILPAVCIEIRNPGATLEPGAEVGVGIFEGVRKVTVRGTTKGRGFTGTIKRWHFQRGRETHGNKNHRAPGSIGAHTFPARVLPGKRMAGHYGDESCTVRNLEVVRIDAERNLLFLRGAVPGPINGVLIVEKV